MIIAVDFDGTVVRQDRPYEDVETPLVLMTGAGEALRALKRAGHSLLLWSARANRALLVDPMLDPLARAGVRRVDMAQWRRSQVVNIARHRQMVEFVSTRLAGVFDAIDDGAAGKPSCDRFIDDRALRLGRGAGGLSWPEIAGLLGVPQGLEPPAGALAVPSVKQETDFSCGAAALLAVLRFFKVTDAKRDRALFKELGTSAKDGTSPEAIASVANGYGLRANWRTGIAVKDLRAAMRAGVPVILDIQETDGAVKDGLPDGHYVVLVGLRDRAQVMNPSGGKYEEIEVDDLVRRWVDTEGRQGGIFVMGPSSR